VELVVSMVIATILVGFVGLTMTMPIQAYLAQARRAELSDSAETATRIIARDVRGALPESLRPGIVGGFEALEMIEVSGVAGYRTWMTGASLDIGQPDDRFDVAGAQTTGRALDRLVVGPSRDPNLPNRDPYLNTAVITPAGQPLAEFNSQRVRLQLPHTFPSGSPNQRAYAVAGSILYLCNTTARVLLRYDNLPIQQAMATAGGGTVVARDIAACTFRTQRSAAEHGGIAIVEITVSRANGGNTESLRVMRQLRVENRP
jgi:MSHA biogenesis protein MshO